MEVSDGTIRIDKQPNVIDDLVIDVTGILDDLGIRFAVVSGYVAVLLGRPRGTEDVDVVVERFSLTTGGDLAARLQSAGFWGPAMPLSDLHETLTENLPIRVAEADRRVPNVELAFAADEYDSASLENTWTVRLGDASFHIGSPELQIAYKLHMGAQRDHEDALYLYELLGSNLNHGQLEAYVEQLGVEEEYDRLQES